MKLRNKKTGEIIDIHKGMITLHCNQGRKTIHFKSIEELEEWENYEEPKEYYCITGRGNLHFIEDMDDEGDKERKQIGNYFETKEEAEKAVEKLKAWKRLKDKGFRFDNFVRDAIYYKLSDEEIEKDEVLEDLDLLFGGEE